tara:strand:- start:622 stop:876 length:255 start_codon:yes stop_codon:yes gene_type:complete
MPRHTEKPILVTWREGEGWSLTHYVGPVLPNGDPLTTKKVDVITLCGELVPTDSGPLYGGYIEKGQGGSKCHVCANRHRRRRRK